jgi:hypothetical protein
MKNKQKRPFEWRMEGSLVEVWLGPFDDPESDLVLKIDLFWVPSLIACLRQIDNKNKNKDGRP